MNNLGRRNLCLTKSKPGTFKIRSYLTMPPPPDYDFRMVTASYFQSQSFKCVLNGNLLGGNFANCQRWEELKIEGSLTGCDRILGLKKWILHSKPIGSYKITVVSREKLTVQNGAETGLKFSPSLSIIASYQCIDPAPFSLVENPHTQPGEFFGFFFLS